MAKDKSAFWFQLAGIVLALIVYSAGAVAYVHKTTEEYTDKRIGDLKETMVEGFRGVNSRLDAMSRRHSDR